MQCSEVSGAVRPIYVSLGVKRLRDKVREHKNKDKTTYNNFFHFFFLSFFLSFYFFLAQQPQLGQDVLIHHVARSQTTR